MIQGGTPAPKREIVNLLLQVLPIETIRTLLKIQAETDLRRRLDDFPKHQLVEAIQSTAEGQSALNDAKARYPLSTKPTLYLVSVSHWPNREELLSVTQNLAQIGHEGQVLFGTDRTIRSIYMVTPLREIQAPIQYFEIPLVYEKKIEYVESDPTSEEYGEPSEIYSLEKSLIWYCSQYKHALLLCGDYSAVKPILCYGTTKLGVSWQSPYFTEEMLQRLAEGATPRSASFSRLDNAIEDEFDAQTMTVFDRELGQSRSFHRLMNDESKQQTSGFYTNHPDLVEGGLGISRQYGRIWTPTKLRKDSLLALSMNLIQKTETELARESEINLDGFISYYRNIPIKINKRKIDSTQRTVFTKLIKGIISAKKSDYHEYVLENDFLNDLIAQRENLDLIVGIEVNCENCGSYLLRCPDCQDPLQPTTNDNGQTIFQCEKHPDALTILDGHQIRCDCGSEMDITLSTDIRIYPGANLLKSLHHFLAEMENQQYDGSFQIQGNILHLVSKNRNGMNQYNLDNFQCWQTRAHLHQRHPGENVAESYRSALSRLKEKCHQNNWHPSRETCVACMREQVTRKKVFDGSTKSNICLPRLMGYAIDMDFDGIHHKHEIADIRYPDVLIDTGEQRNIGIHLKSRERPRKSGLGRSASGIKGLYAQYCHSVYSSAHRDVNMEIVGISIPNTINQEVTEDFQYLSNQLGFPLVILTEEDWVKILDAVLEKAEIEEL